MVSCQVPALRRTQRIIAPDSGVLYRLEIAAILIKKSVTMRCKEEVMVRTESEIFERR